MRKPPSAVSSTALSGSREMSISREGRSTSSFIRSIRLVPPAMNFAFGSAIAVRTASAMPLARVDSKLITALPPSSLCSVQDLEDRRYDVRVGAATTDVAAHQLAHLVRGLRFALGE